ncbi:TonB family protein [Azonexus sp.]|jgi:protein TonB|uniref:energy transducer TonB n=1 Tax=Azonexus sp. TaxID=1872668 RepID=UPI0028271E28|nr:TonB family protein [Azonexus sp.]MDR1995760.1 TonB family protein [Azonexus sp.]
MAALYGQPADRGDRRLWLAIGISLAVHAALMLVHFHFPNASQAIREKALDIILVNAKSARKPTDAQALAQTNLDGGGTTDDKRRVKTPLPPTKRQTDGDDLQQMQRRVQELEAAQQAMLTQAKSPQTVSSSKTASEQPTPANPVSGLDLLERSRAMARLEGEISKNTEEYNKRPRKMFVGARAEEYALAAYLEAWKQKIERIGTLNYPEAARGRLYGAVVIYVELSAEDGSIYNAEISRSSGHKILDQAALRILRMSGPFGPIPREPLGGATILSFARTWHFTQGDALNTASAPR